MLRQTEGEELAQGVVRPGKEGPRLAAVAIGQEEADVAVEELQVVVVPRDHDGPAGIPGVLRPDQARLFQDFLGQLVQPGHAEGTLAQGAQDAEAGQGRQRRERIGCFQELAESGGDSFPQGVLQFRAAGQRRGDKVGCRVGAAVPKDLQSVLRAAFVDGVAQAVDGAVLAEAVILPELHDAVGEGVFGR